MGITDLNATKILPKKFTSQKCDRKNLIVYSSPVPFIGVAIAARSRATVLVTPTPKK